MAILPHVVRVVVKKRQDVNRYEMGHVASAQLPCVGEHVRVSFGAYVLFGMVTSILHEMFSVDAELGGSSKYLEVGSVPMPAIEVTLYDEQAIQAFDAYWRGVQALLARVNHQPDTFRK